MTKFAVTHAGRVKCAIRFNTAQQTTGGIAELADQHAPAPDAQKIVFDPANHLSFWPRRFANSKTGLVGGHLNIANVGGYTAANESGSGFDLVAFAPSSGTGGPGPLEYATSVLVRLRARARLLSLRRQSKSQDSTLEEVVLEVLLVRSSLARLVSRRRRVGGVHVAVVRGLVPFLARSAEALHRRAQPAQQRPWRSNAVRS